MQGQRQRRPPFTIPLLLLVALSLFAQATPAETAPGPAARWLQAAADGAPVSLPLEDGPRLALLAESALLRATGVRVLEGSLVDEPRSEVRIVVADGEAMGIVVRADGASVFGTSPDVARAWGGASSAEPHVDLPGDAEDYIYDATRFDALSEYALGEPECRRYFPEEELAPASGLRDGWAERRLQVAFAYDAAYGRAFGANALPAAVFLAATVDATYAYDLDIRVEAVDIHGHDEAEFPTTHFQGVIEDAQRHYEAAHPSLRRELVHVVTGREIPDAAGMANCIGGAGNESLAYSWGEAAPDRYSPRIASDASTRIAAHEIGHLLAAHHHYASCGETGYRAFRTTEACTIMLPVVDLMQLRFSSLNRLVMRGYADAHDL